MKKEFQVSEYTRGILKGEKIKNGYEEKLKIDKKPVLKIKKT